MSVTCETLEEVWQRVKERELADNVQFATATRDKTFGSAGKVNSGDL